ncbi:MAG: sugar phosphate isomerase/epimerase [Verrucomicrobiae bacterium]|nr:sugar phosphate isomerase/epimerase [Verrucomicrobiae bacterium]
MLAFSTCWNSHRHTDGVEMISEIILLGFNAMEISHGTRVTLIPGILRIVNAKRQTFRVAGVHNFCPSPVEVLMDAPDVYEISSKREEEYQRAIKLTLQSIDTAVQMKASYVVLHLGSTPVKPRTRTLEKLVSSGELNSRDFVREKLELVKTREEAGQKALPRVREALARIIPYAEEKGVRLGFESRSHFEQIPTEREMLALLEEYRESPAVGYWHDFGHVQRKANLGLLDHEQWLAAAKDRLIGCHLHDVIWPEKDHHVPFSGSIDFDRLVPLLPPEAPIVWEINPRRRSAHIKESLTVWKERFGVPEDEIAPVC